MLRSSRIRIHQWEAQLEWKPCWGQHAAHSGTICISGCIMSHRWLQRLKGIRSGRTSYKPSCSRWRLSASSVTKQERHRINRTDCLSRVAASAVHICLRICAASMHTHMCHHSNAAAYTDCIFQGAASAAHMCHDISSNTAAYARRSTLPQLQRSKRQQSNGSCIGVSRGSKLQRYCRICLCPRLQMSA